MEISSFNKYNQTGFSLIGKMCTLNDYQLLKNHFTNIKNKSKNVIVDLSRLTFTSSHGLGTLISISKTLKKMGKNLILFNPREEIELIIKTAGIDKIIRIIQNENKLAEISKNKTFNTAE